MSFALQEVNGQKPPGAKARRLDALDLVLRGTPYEAFHRAHSLRENTGGAFDAHNLVTLSRFPFSEVRQVLHAYVPPIAYRFVSIPAAGIGNRDPMGTAAFADGFRTPGPRPCSCRQSASARAAGVAGSRRKAVGAHLARHILLGGGILCRGNETVGTGARSTAARGRDPRSRSAGGHHRLRRFQCRGQRHALADPSGVAGGHGQRRSGLAGPGALGWARDQ